MNKSVLIDDLQHRAFKPGMWTFQQDSARCHRLRHSGTRLRYQAAPWQVLNHRPRVPPSPSQGLPKKPNSPAKVSHAFPPRGRRNADRGAGQRVLPRLS